MGGSLAMGLKEHVARLNAVDKNQKTIQYAIDEKIIDSGTVELIEGVRSADLIILATPVNHIIDVIQKLPHHRPEGCLVLDVGSTKRLVCQEMSKLPANFGALGGHPMCGKERSGLEVASADLYDGQTFILCRHERTNRAIENLSLEIIQVIRANPLFLSPQRHDYLVSATSHLPYLVSSLLMTRVDKLMSEDPMTFNVSGTGMRDTTRLAGSNPTMMLDILSSNRDEIIHQLYGYRSELDDLIMRLEDLNEDALLDWLRSVREAHQHYLAQKWSS